LEKVTIGVYGIVGSSFCIGADDGDLVFQSIQKALKEDKSIIVSFQNVEMITSAFLNSAIGQLYREFSEETIKNHLTLESLSKEDAALLRRVVRTAKLYYADPERLNSSVSQVLGE
jgi:Icc-related predicted phosphoesterase